jgi:hypothetical protein
VKPEATVEGRPTLVLADEDRGAIADILADVLIALLEDVSPQTEGRAGVTQAARRNGECDDSHQST